MHVALRLGRVDPGDKFQNALDQATNLAIARPSVRRRLCLPECMPVCYYMGMKRTALFLKEAQLKKLQALSSKTGAPVAELIRRAIDMYLGKKANK